MKPKLACKIIIDFLMMISLLALMAYELIGAATHEVIGTFMFGLMIAHNILNRKWWQGLIKGRYTPLRAVQTIVNVLIFLGLITQMVSGIMMSRHVFAFLAIDGGAYFARTMHLIGAYWSFVLMSVHLGLHGSILMGIAKRFARKKDPSRIGVFFLRAAALLISAYGAYAFFGRGLGSYMLLKNQFVFFDFEEPLILFFADYVAIALLFACLGYYLMRWITPFSQKGSSTE